MTRMFRFFLAFATLLPIQSQEPSTFNYSTINGAQTVQIRNISYEITGTNIPGRPANDRLVLRKTVRSKQVLDDIGMEATVTLDAWRLGDDLKQKAIYTLSVAGSEAVTKDDALFVVARGLEEVEWWSVYKLGDGQRLFDTYVPLQGFSISRETVTTRYVGFEVPPDDTKDAKLKQPNVIGVLYYASASHVIDELLLTSDDHSYARLLRSYADVTRTLSASEGAIRLTFTQNYPSPPNPADLVIKLKGDDLDLANARLPARIHAIRQK